MKKTRKRLLTAAVAAIGAVGATFVPLFRANMTVEEYARHEKAIAAAVLKDRQMTEHYGFNMLVSPQKKAAEQGAGLVFTNKNAIDKDTSGFTKRLNQILKEAGLNIKAGTPKVIEYYFRSGTLQHSIIPLKGNHKVNFWKAQKERMGEYDYEPKHEKKPQPMNPLMAKRKPAMQRQMYRVQHRA